MLLYEEMKKQPPPQGRGATATDSGDAPINRQLLVVLGRLMQRRTTKMTAAAVAAADRTAILRQCLSADKRDRVKSLVKTITELGISLTGGCSAGGCCVQVVSPISLQGEMPEPVRQLFTQTKLLATVQNTPISKLATVPWDDLIAQAETNVANYQTWLVIQKQESNCIRNNGIP
jgi:hypothetical protein